jgi:hypothetical protein
MIDISGCVFSHPRTLNLIENSIPNKVIALRTSANVQLSDSFLAKLIPDGGTINVESDLNGLRK